MNLKKTYLLWAFPLAILLVESLILAQICFRGFQEFLRLLDHLKDDTVLNIRVERIIPNLPLIERSEQLIVKFRVHFLCLCKMLSVCRDDVSVLAKLETLFVE